MKKIILFVLASLMLSTLVLTACTTGNQQSGKTETQAESVSETIPKTETDARTEPKLTDTETSEITEATEAKDTESDTEPVTEEKQLTAADPTKAYRILFVGNSFTYYNDMPAAIFSRIAKEAGYNVTVDAVTKGGYYLWQFLDETDTYGKQVQNKLDTVSYDIVIIQEQSSCPIANPGLFYDSVRKFQKLIKANGAEMWLYDTWGYKTGHSGLASFGSATGVMEMKLRAAYSAIADELGIKVSYAGAAMQYVFDNTPAIDLYNSDLKHPSAAGSYLIAWTHFATVFGVDVRKLTYCGAMNEADAAVMKEAAYLVALNGAAVDEAYKTVSTGVTNKSETVDNGIDIMKTVNLTVLPTGKIISYIKRNSTEAKDGWVALKDDSTQTFSGIRGDKDKIASTEYSASALTDGQKEDLADIGYGVSVIGAEYMDSSKKGYATAVQNLCNGHWGTTYMATLVFGAPKYNISGSAVPGGKYAGLITLNFGSVKTFDSIGYFSGSLLGFPQVQEVFVSDDGINWKRVEAACYDTLAMNSAGKSLFSIDTKVLDPWNSNKATKQVLFSMDGVTGKYIRIGIITGGDMTSSGASTINLNGPQAINTREIVVYGK